MDAQHESQTAGMKPRGRVKPQIATAMDGLETT